MKIIKSMLFSLLVLNGITAAAQDSKQMKSTDVKTTQVERMKVRKVINEFTPEQVAKQQTDKMTELLSLSQEQITNVYELNLKVARKIDVIKKSDMTPERKIEFIEGNGKDRMNALSTVLSSEQYAEYVTYMSDQETAE